MRIHLIKRQSIWEFVLKNSGSRSSFEDWLTKVKMAEWESPADIIYTFNTADILGKSSSRVVFNIGGNNYRMICKFAFGTREVHLFVCWIGTHAAYDELCAKNKQYTENRF